MTPYDLFQDFGEKLKVVPQHWATFSLATGFVLYVLGYLAVRFHLTTLGVGTDLRVLDERYLFAGAKFLVYLVASVLNVIFLGLIVAALGYLPFRLITRLRRAEQAHETTRSGESPGRGSSPKRLALLGIVFSLLVIQLFMRQSFFLGNLLIAPSLPEHPRWLANLLVDRDGFGLDRYFDGLVAATLISTGIMIATARLRPSGHFERAVFWVLIIFVAVEGLFLPINYGALILDKSLPRVASLNGEQPLATDQDAWLVWEGSLGNTYLVRQKSEGRTTRSLVTLDRKDVRSVEIIGYDRILAELFAKR
jgi:hypothetical protein